jgi:hypothetical protein
MTSYYSLIQLLIFSRWERAALPKKECKTPLLYINTIPWYKVCLKMSALAIKLMDLYL